MLELVQCGSDALLLLATDDVSEFVVVLQVVGHHCAQLA